MNWSSFYLMVALVLVTQQACRTRGECWDTGCQSDASSVKGCEQYDGMTEIKRTPCKSNAIGTVGYVYSCCHQKNSMDPSHQLCRATGCVHSTHAVKGCQQYQGTIEVERSPCGGEGGSGAPIAGHAYFCCDDPNRGGGGASGPAAAATGIQLNMTGHLTYYDLLTGLTACGRSCSNDDLVAAIAPGHFTAPNSNRDSVCGKRAKIVDPTTLKSVVVTVWDKCGGCGANDVDVSPAAFERLKPKTVGRFKVVWGFV